MRVSAVLLISPTLAVVLTTVWLIASALAQVQRPASPQAERGGARVALVVGIGRYDNVPELPNPPRDARAIHAALGRVGFESELLIDPDRSELEGAIQRLGDRARGADAALFYFAGHAIELAGKNWLLPRSVTMRTDRAARFEAVELDGVTETIEGGARVSLLFLDACRDNPFRLRLASRGARSVGGSGLAQMRAAVGTLLAFATAPGNIADDGDGEHSPFTAAMLRYIETPGLEVRQMLGRVRAAVRQATAGRQLPWDHSSLEGDFYFVQQAALATSPTAEVEAIAVRERFQVLDALRTLAHLDPNAPPIFGPATARAIRQFQSFEGAEETGELTASQRQRLFNLAAQLNRLLDVPARSPTGRVATSLIGGEQRFQRGWQSESGEGSPRNDAEANYWYALAAGDGHVAATNNLGLRYARGQGATRSGGNAALLWRVAAARGEGTAAFNLGTMYERGTGVPANREIALRWYRLARDLGNRNAAAALARLDN
jgi:Caspase domain/Sel1 repeat/Putative peptidoglycan binding domain